MERNDALSELPHWLYRKGLTSPANIISRYEDTPVAMLMTLCRGGCLQEHIGRSMLNNLYGFSAADAYANGSGGNDLLPALWVGGSFQQKPANSPMEMSMILTLDLLKKAKTKKGGYSLKQIEMGTELAGGTPWLRKIIGKDVIPEWWQKFNVCKGFDKQPASKPEKGKVLNAMPVAAGWEWKPKQLDVPPLKISTPATLTKSQKKRINRHKKKVISRADNEKFYISREWRELRARVLEMYECRCMMCGRTPKQHNVIIHVDHIRPRSKHPDLSLEITNLQLLCEDCNLGKSNKYDTDWRPENELSPTR